ncbi:MAG: hypothetical protein Q3966_06960 [Neisseria sp.]|nr:hypothetical protein [Neisseria sp.]
MWYDKDVGNRRFWLNGKRRSTNNTHYVCFDCRTAVKREKGYDNETAPLPPVLCPHCGTACIQISSQVEIPPKGKIRLWRRLRESYAGEPDEIAILRSLTCRKHFAERRLAGLVRELEQAQGGGDLERQGRLKGKIAAKQQKIARLAAEYECRKRL